MICIGLRDASHGFVDEFGWTRLHRHRQPLGWWVVANDKWHDPRRSPSVRQRQIDGTPVVETKIAVPGGDVVQRVFVAVDQGGVLVYEFENRSADAVAVAVDARNMSTSAANHGTTPQGIDLPRDARVFPLARESTIRCAWSLNPPRWGHTSRADLALVPSADSVVRGWVRACEHASRFSPVDSRITSARCQLLMASRGDIDDLVHDDAALGVLAIGERVRTGDQAEHWVAEVAGAVRKVGKRPSASPWSHRALQVATRVLKLAHEDDAAHEVLQMWQRLIDTQPAEMLESKESGATDHTTADFTGITRATVDLARIEDDLVRAVAPNLVQLFSGGLSTRRDHNFEAHELLAGPDHRISLAVRWHGPNAAVLWEVQGPPGLRLTAPSVDRVFDSSAPQGEALVQLDR